jgi:hypothetical protein
MINIDLMKEFIYSQEWLFYKEYGTKKYVKQLDNSLCIEISSKYSPIEEQILTTLEIYVGERFSIYNNLIDINVDRLKTYTPEECINSSIKKIMEG